MPAPTKITKRFPIPKELHLLKEKIRRPCDSEYWKIHGRHFGLEACMDLIKSDLIEREKQLFAYYRIPYVKINDNSIHYLIRQLAAAAGFRGFEFQKRYDECKFGDWRGKFGERFCLLVILDRLKNNTSQAQSIKNVSNNHSDYNYYARLNVNLEKRYCEVVKSNPCVKEFHSKITKNMSQFDKNQLIDDIELYLNACHNIQVNPNKS